MDTLNIIAAIFLVIFVLIIAIVQIYMVSFKKGLHLLFLTGLFLFPFNNIFIIRLGSIDTRLLSLFWAVPIVAVLVKSYSFLNSRKIVFPIVLLFLFVVLNFVSISIASYKFVALRESIQFFYFFSVFLLTITAVDGKEELTRTAKMIVVISFIFSAYGLLEFLYGELLVRQFIVNLNNLSISVFDPGLKEQETLAGHLIIRAESLNWGTVATAQYLLAFIFVLLALINKSGKISSRYSIQSFQIISLVLSVLLLMLTYSRAAYFILLILMIFYFKYLSLPLKRFVVLTGLLLAIGVFSNALLSSRLGEIGTTYEGSNAFHYAMYIAALAMVWAHPILGVGSGNFIELVPEYTNTFLYKYVVASDTHNFVLQTVAEVGILGLIPLLILFYIVAFRFFSKKGFYTSLKDETALINGFGYGFVATVLMALTMNGFKVEFFWILLGIVLRTSTNTEIKLYEDSQS